VTELAEIPQKWWTPDPSVVAKLPRGGNGTPSSCRTCGGYHKPGAIHLDYVGHADLTRALIEIDPEWDWVPVAFDGEGLPLISKRNNQLVLWGRLTLLGQQRLCVGTCDATKSDAEKELVGDLLRNGGMRFGVFGSLWSKASGWTDTPDEPTHAHSSAPRLSQEQQDTIAAHFEAVLDDDVRKTRKQAFVRQFGKPDAILADFWPDVLKFIAEGQ
jgi:hypothetical protein